MSVIIYHNPRCSKSRETLALLESHHIQPQVELYLQQRYSVEKLQEIANKLGITDIRQMMRTKDELYQSLGLDNPTLSTKDLLLAISQHSALLVRRFVILAKNPKRGRPPDSVLTFLKKNPKKRLHFYRLKAKKKPDIMSGFIFIGCCKLPLITYTNTTTYITLGIGVTL